MEVISNILVTIKTGTTGSICNTNMIIFDPIQEKKPSNNMKYWYCTNKSNFDNHSKENYLANVTNMWLNIHCTIIHNHDLPSLISKEYICSTTISIWKAMAGKPYMSHKSVWAVAFLYVILFPLIFSIVCIKNLMCK